MRRTICPRLSSRSSVDRRLQRSRSADNLRSIVAHAPNSRHGGLSALQRGLVAAKSCELHLCPACRSVLHRLLVRQYRPGSRARRPRRVVRCTLWPPGEPLWSTSIGPSARHVSEAHVVSLTQHPEKTSVSAARLSTGSESPCAAALLIAHPKCRSTLHGKPRSSPVLVIRARQADRHSVVGSGYRKCLPSDLEGGRPSLPPDDKRERHHHRGASGRPPTIKAPCHAR